MFLQVQDLFRAIFEFVRLISNKSFLNIMLQNKLLINNLTKFTTFQVKKKYLSFLHRQNLVRGKDGFVFTPARELSRYLHGNVMKNYSRPISFYVLLFLMLLRSQLYNVFGKYCLKSCVQKLSGKVYKYLYQLIKYKYAIKL